jgi:hypothetical protein
MIVCSRLGQRWKWFFPSADITKAICPVDEPSKDTLAYDLLRGSQAVEGPVEVAADGWINREDSERYTLIEDSIVVAYGMVLSLLWWKDEQQLIDIGDL